MATRGVTPGSPDREAAKAWAGPGCTDAGPTVEASKVAGRGGAVSPCRDLHAASITRSGAAIGALSRAAVITREGGAGASAAATGVRGEGSMAAGRALGPRDVGATAACNGAPGIIDISAACAEAVPTAALARGPTKGRAADVTGTAASRLWSGGVAAADASTPSDGAIDGGGPCRANASSA